MTDRPAERAIDAFIRRGEWPPPGTLPVCIRLPQMGWVPPSDDPRRKRETDAQS